MPDSLNVRNSIDYQIGQRLKNRRQMLKLSQDDLATVVGITFQQIQKYEAGHNRMSASRLFNISKILNIPINYFFDGLVDINNQEDEYKTLSVNEADIFDPLSDSKTLSLVNAYWKMDEDSREKIYELILTMSKK